VEAVDYAASRVLGEDLPKAMNFRLASRREGEWRSAARPFLSAVSAPGART
jgi:hypothetical protein